MTDEFPRPRNYHLMLVFHIDSTTPMAKRRFRSGCRSLQLLHVFLPHGNGHTRRWIWRKSYEFTMLPDCISTNIYKTYVNIPKSRSLNKYRNQSLASTSHPQLCGFPAAGRSLDLPALKVHNKAHLSVSPFSCRKMGVETKLRPVSFICNRKNRTCLD